MCLSGCVGVTERKLPSLNRCWMLEELKCLSILFIKDFMEWGIYCLKPEFIIDYISTTVEDYDK